MGLGAGFGERLDFRRGIAASLQGEVPFRPSYSGPKRCCGCPGKVPAIA